MKMSPLDGMGQPRFAFEGMPPGVTRRWWRARSSAGRGGQRRRLPQWPMSAGGRRAGATIRAGGSTWGEDEVRRGRGLRDERPAVEHDDQTPAHFVGRQREDGLDTLPARAAEANRSTLIADIPFPAPENVAAKRCASEKRAV